MADYRKMRVLYIDDVNSVRSVIEKCLAHFEFNEVEGAADGAEAWEKLQKAVTNENPFHLIFCDWNMPRLKGIDLLKMIRLHPDQRIKKVKFIMITGSAEKIKEAIEAGAHHCISKPFTSKQIQEKLELVLE